MKVGDLVDNTEGYNIPPGIVIKASTDSPQVWVVHFNGETQIWMHTLLRVLK